MKILYGLLIIGIILVLAISLNDMPVEELECEIIEETIEIRITYEDYKNITDNLPEWVPSDTGYNKPELPMNTTNLPLVISDPFISNRHSAQQIGRSLIIPSTTCIVVDNYDAVYLFNNSKTLSLYDKFCPENKTLTEVECECYSWGCAAYCFKCDGDAE